MNITFPEITPVRLEKIIRGAERYSFQDGTALSPKKGEKCFVVHGWIDFETYPICEFVWLKCFKNIADSVDKSTWDWDVGICYTATEGDVFDYKKKFDFNNKKKRPAFVGLGSQAEKWTKFKLDDEYFLSEGGVISNGRKARILSDLLKLEEYIFELDSLTSGLSSWGASGSDMLIVCSYYSCANRAVLPNEIILGYAANGLSLEVLRKRLVCKDCGRKLALLKPRKMGHPN